MLEGLGLVFNTAGAVLAIIGYADFIAITVSAAAVMMALNDYFYIPAQLSETNRALSDLHNLITTWDSLSLVQVVPAARHAMGSALYCAFSAPYAMPSPMTSSRVPYVSLPAQRKTRGVKQVAAQTCEGAVLALCQSRTAVSSALPNQDAGADEE